jgi:hypothetical protein
MEPKKNTPEETVGELSKRIDSEQDLEKLLDLISKTQRLMHPQQSQKKLLPK